MSKGTVGGYLFGLWVVRKEYERSNILIQAHEARLMKKKTHKAGKKLEYPTLGKGIGNLNAYHFAVSSIHYPAMATPALRTYVEGSTGLRPAWYRHI